MNTLLLIITALILGGIAGYCFLQTIDISHTEINENEANKE